MLDYDLTRRDSIRTKTKIYEVLLYASSFVFAYALSRLAFNMIDYLFPKREHLILFSSFVFTLVAFILVMTFVYIFSGDLKDEVDEVDRKRRKDMIEFVSLVREASICKD